MAFDREAFCERLKRSMGGRSIAGLARDVGISESTMGAIANGKSVPGTSTLAGICEALEVDANYLLGLRDEPRTRKRPPAKRQPIEVDGKRYETVPEAAEAIGTRPEYIRYQMRKFGEVHEYMGHRMRWIK